MTKRPDQYQIAPEEGGATDYKNYPLKPGDLNAGGREAKRKAEQDEGIWQQLNPDQAQPPEPSGEQAEVQGEEKAEEK
jgi:hypothetical protein